MSWWGLVGDVPLVASSKVQYGGKELFNLFPNDWIWGGCSSLVSEGSSAVH